MPPDPNKADNDEDDDDEEEEDSGDEEEEEDDAGGCNEASRQQPEFEAVCHYKTILKDAPPGFENDSYEVNYHHLSGGESCSEHSNNKNDGGGAPANDHNSSPGQNWSDPNFRCTSNFVFTQKEGFRLRASAKVEEQQQQPTMPPPPPTQMPHPAPPTSAGGGFKLRVSSDTDNSRSLRPVVRSSSTDRILDSSDYGAHQDSAGVACMRSYTSTQDESSDVPQAVFIRPPAKMRIFQTEVEDDDDDEEDDDDDDVDDDDDEACPPIPPPRSKSKESSLSTGPLASRHRSSKEIASASEVVDAAGLATSRSPNDRSVYFDAMQDQQQCHDPSSKASTSGGLGAPQRRTTPAGQDRSLGSFRESQNVESVSPKEIVKNQYHHSEVASSGGDSCSRSCSDHSNKNPQNSTGLLIIVEILF